MGFVFTEPGMSISTKVFFMTLSLAVYMLLVWLAVVRPDLRQSKFFASVSAIVAAYTVQYVLHLCAILSFDIPTALHVCLFGALLFSMARMAGLDGEDLLVLAILPIVALITWTGKLFKKN